jgi:hypothetical protein
VAGRHSVEKWIYPIVKQEEEKSEATREKKDVVKTREKGETTMDQVRRQNR